MKWQFKRIWFRSEPYSFTCPKCGARMDWNAYQGPLGGWCCPKCGLRVDYKG